MALVAGWAARTFPQDTRIAAVFPDGPQRYFDTIYNDDYCHQHQLLDWQPVAEPTVITDPTQQVVTSWTRTSTVVNPALIAAA